MAERVLTLRIEVQNTQATQALNNYNNSLRTMQTNQAQAQSGIVGLNQGFNEFNQVLNTAVLGISAMKVLELAGDMNRLGQEVNIAKRVFEALAGGSREAGDMLEYMREKTGAVVSDLDLMKGASRLLQMGLADSKEEVAGLTEMAVKLGGALGMSTNKAIEDFSLLLSNMSFLRLDQFGISAGAVRARVEELKEEFPEMTREARFAMAVLEEGQGALEDLGEAANSASTAMNRMGTMAENEFQRLSSNLNIGAEAIARFLEVTLFELPQARAEAVAAASYEFADMSEDIINGLLGTGIQGNVGADRVSNFIIEAYRMALSDPELWTNLDSFSQQVQQRLMQAGVQGPDVTAFGSQEEMDRSLRMWLTYLAQSEQSILQQRQYAEQYAATLQEVEDMRAQRGEEMASILNRQRETERNILDIENMRAQRGEEMAAAANEMRAYDQLRAGALSGLQGQVGDVSAMGNFGANALGDFAPMQQFTNEQTAQDMEEQARWAQRQLEYMEDLKDAHGESVFSDEDLATAEEYVDQIRGMADESRRMADALKDASLSELFGQSGGGRQGEMSDAVLQFMRDSGQYTDEQLAAAESTFAISTGRETASSNAFNDVIVPAMASLPADEAAIAMQNLDEFMTTLAGAGFDINSLTPEQILTGAGMVQLGDGAPNMTIVVASGDTLSGIATEGGTTVADLLRSNPQITNPNLIHPGDEIAMGPAAPEAGLLGGFEPEMFAQSIIDASQPMADMSANMDNMADKGDRFMSATGEMAGKMNAAANDSTTIAANLAKLVGEEQPIRLRFVVDASAIRLAINDALGQFNLSRGVIDTHGQVPGAVARGGSNVS